MPFSLRLDPDTEARIRQLAKATGRSRSAVVREAVSQYGDADVKHFEIDRTALDRLRPFAGVVSTAKQNSTDTHQKYRAILAKKHRGGRSR